MSTAATENLVELYEEAMSHARALLVGHNTVAGKGNLVDIDNVLATLKREGGTSVEALAACSYEDLNGFGFPKLLACQRHRRRRLVRALDRTI